MDIKQKIDKLRKQRGWSLSKLAKKAGLAETTVYNWYNEKNASPSRRAIEDICEVFEMSLSEFFNDVEFDKLTEKQVLLLELFEKVPDNKKDTVIAIIKSFTE